MPAAKGTLVVFLRKFMRERGAELETEFLERLTDSDREVYQTAMTVAWYDVPVVGRLYDVASKVAFPKDPDRLRRIGEASARHDLTGIYKVFLLVVSVPFVIKQTARMWKTYHDTGDAEVIQEKGKKLAALVIKNHPTLPSSLQEMIAGYIVAGLELAGAKNVHVNRVATNPDAWKWMTSWE